MQPEQQPETVRVNPAGFSVGGVRPHTWGDVQQPPKMEVSVNDFTALVRRSREMENSIATMQLTINEVLEKLAFQESITDFHKTAGENAVKEITEANEKIRLLTEEIERIKEQNAQVVVDVTNLQKTVPIETTKTIEIETEKIPEEFKERLLHVEHEASYHESQMQGLEFRLNMLESQQMDDEINDNIGDDLPDQVCQCLLKSHFNAFLVSEGVQKAITTTLSLKDNVTVDVNGHNLITRKLEDGVHEFHFNSFTQ